MSNKLFVSKFTDETLQNIVEQAMNWLEWRSIIPNAARVAIKPNFTYPFFKPGVTTSPKFIDALVAVLREQTPHISIVESDGGSNSWTAEEAFEGHELEAICKKYGVRTVNLSRLPVEMAETTVAGRKIQVPLPTFLLRDIDVFITMPVPKVHAMTEVTLGFKNQWGCIADTKRIRHHPEFSHKVVAINKLLKPSLVVFDGEFFLNRMGPMDGDLVEKQLVIASNDIGYGSLACCKIMGINPSKVRHLRVANQEGIFPWTLDGCSININPVKYYDQTFYIKREFQSWAAYWAFHSRLGTNLWYVWPFTAKILHKILYAVKGKPKDFSPSY